MGVIVGDAITKFYFVITYRWIALRFKGEIIQMALLLRSQIMKSIHRAKPLAFSLLLGFCLSATATDPNDRVLTYSAETDVLVSFKLLPRQNEVGRDNAIYDNYRPQVRFSAEKKTIMCAVHVSKAMEKIEPGETVEVPLNCVEPFHVFEKNKSFVAYEGGRKVAEGAIR